MADEIKNTENQELDWDSPISKDAGEFEIPPIGEYTFTVANLEKTMSKSGNKMADLTISLDVNGQAYVRHDYLVLTSNMAWKLASFFECIGLKEKGQELTHMPWDKVPGARGRCKIIHEDYNGRPTVRIDRYLPLTGSAPAQATAATAPANDMPFEV
ncbi:MAG: DUF669 domain-containing protein [Clostridiales bacterium]|nr:DUF669 domain-containing protein [Clostridiales bacterium]